MNIGKLLIPLTLISSISIDAAIAHTNNEFEKRVLNANGVSSIDDSQKFVYFLEEKGPRIKVTRKTEIEATFKANKKALRLENVTLVGFPENKKGVSWEAIDVNNDNTKALLISEDSELGKYVLYMANIEVLDGHIHFNLQQKKLWQGNGKISDQRLTTRPLNNGGVRKHYDNWNHGFEAIAWDTKTNSTLILHETSEIAPSTLNLNTLQSVNTGKLDHQYRVSDITTVGNQGLQCLLAVSFCWNGDSSELCSSTKTKSALHVFALENRQNTLAIKAESKNILSSIGTNKFNAEGILLLDNYIYLVNDSSAPRGTTTYLTRFKFKEAGMEGQNFKNWLSNCTTP